MIEEAVIFVIGEKESGLTPNLRIGSEGIKNLRNVPRPKIGRPVGVLTVGLRRDNPAYLRELVAARFSS